MSRAISDVVHPSRFWLGSLLLQFSFDALNISSSTRTVLPTPEDISKPENMGENFLGLYPDPAHFVQYIESLDRLDMASELFVRLLEVYYSIDAEQDTDPLRCVDIAYPTTCINPSSEAYCIFN